MMSTSTVTGVTTDRSTVCNALEQAGIPAFRMVTVLEQEDMVILSGRLPSYYLKQLAQEAALPHLGHRVLENRITVVPR